MKKLVIVTDGSKVRGFLLRGRLNSRSLCVKCSEVHSSSLCDDPVALARQIDNLVIEHSPEFWNLSAPRDLLNSLVCLLGSHAAERLTRTRVGNLVGSSVTEIVLQFPLAPGQPATPRTLQPKARESVPARA